MLPSLMKLHVPDEQATLAPAASARVCVARQVLLGAATVALPPRESATVPTNVAPTTLLTAPFSCSCDACTRTPSAKVSVEEAVAVRAVNSSELEALLTSVVAVAATETVLASVRFTAPASAPDHCSGQFSTVVGGSQTVEPAPTPRLARFAMAGGADE